MKTHDNCNKAFCSYSVFNALKCRTCSQLSEENLCTECMCSWTIVTQHPGCEDLFHFLTANHRMQWDVGWGETHQSEMKHGGDDADRITFLTTRRIVLQTTDRMNWNLRFRSLKHHFVVFWRKLLICCISSANCLITLKLSHHVFSIPLWNLWSLALQTCL